MDPNDVVEVFRRNLTEHYFDLAGRVGRREFWYFVLACVVVFVVAAIVDSILPVRLLQPLVGLALLLPMTGMTARRLQDTGRNGSIVWVWAGLSGLMQVIGLLTAMTGPFGVAGFLFFFFSIGWLIALAALAISVLLIYYCIQPGNAGENQYGPEPKGAAAAPPTA